MQFATGTHCWLSQMQKILQKWKVHLGFCVKVCKKEKHNEIQIKKIAKSICDLRKCFPPSIVCLKRYYLLLGVLGVQHFILLPQFRLYCKKGVFLLLSPAKKHTADSAVVRKCESKNKKKQEKTEKTRKTKNEHKILWQILLRYPNVCWPLRALASG